MEKRYVIFEYSNYGDRYETILPAGTTEERARELARRDWEHLTKSEKKEKAIHLALMDCKIDRDLEQYSVGDIIEDGYGYNPIEEFVQS